MCAIGLQLVLSRKLLSKINYSFFLSISHATSYFHEYLPQLGRQVLYFIQFLKRFRKKYKFSLHNQCQLSHSVTLCLFCQFSIALNDSGTESLLRDPDDSLCDSTEAEDKDESIHLSHMFSSSSSLAGDKTHPADDKSPLRPKSPGGSFDPHGFLEVL